MKNKKIIIILSAVITILLLGLTYALFFNFTSKNVTTNIKDIDVANEYESFNKDLSLYEGVHYKSNLGAPIKESLKIDSLTERFGVDALKIKWLKTKIDSSSDDYYLYWDPGASGDAGFSFYIKTKNNSFVYVGSTPIGLKIPGNGFLYTKSHINEFFDAYRKYKINDKGVIEEVLQQQLHVGLKTKSNKLITVYSNTDLKKVAFKISKGSDVYVDSFIQTFIQTEFSTDWGLFFVKNSDGKTGWISSEDAGANTQCVVSENGEFLSSPEVSLPGLCYLGD